MRVRRARASFDAADLLAPEQVTIEVKARLHVG
jgi:hypothetical protein